MSGLTQDVKRLITENLSQTWQKFVVAVGFILTLLSVFGFLGSERLTFFDKLRLSSGVLFAIGLFYLVYFLVHSLRRAYTLLPASKGIHRHSVDTLAMLFGIRKTSLEIECVIAPDGSSESTYDVALTAEVDEITQVEYRSTTPSLPEGTGKNIAVEFISSNSNGVVITAEVLGKTRADCFWTVNFSPGLKVNQTVDYRHRVCIPAGAFAQSSDEMKRRGLDFECYSMQVNYPTDRLRIRVTFPTGTEPSNLTHDTWFGRGRVRHMHEYSRIVVERAFRSGRNKDGKLFGEIEIPCPIHGLRYVIRWIPGGPCLPHAEND